MTCNWHFSTSVQPQLMLNYHHQPRCAWADHGQSYCQVVVNHAGTEKHRDRMQERQTEMKDHHDKTSRKEDYSQVRQSEFCITRRKRGALERLYQSATSQEATSSRARGLPAKTVRFSDEPARPIQIVQQHVSEQPDTVHEADSLQPVQSEKGETTQCVTSTRPGRRIRLYLLNAINNL